MEPDRTEQRLDEALEETFPASDPVAILLAVPPAPQQSSEARQERKSSRQP